MNANNNSYSCLRTINSTHNFLYCEFTTGFKTFYNLRLGKMHVSLGEMLSGMLKRSLVPDPFEQLNRISTLTVDEANLLSSQLADLKACKGVRQCSLGMARDVAPASSYHPRVNRGLLY